MTNIAAPRTSWITLSLITGLSLILWIVYFANPTFGHHLALGVLAAASTTSVLAGLNLCIIVILRRVAQGQQEIFTEVYDDHRQIVAKIEGQEARVDDAYWSGYGDCSDDRKPNPPFPPHRLPGEE